MPIPMPDRLFELLLTGNGGGCEPREFDMGLELFGVRGLLNALALPCAELYPIAELLLGDSGGLCSSRAFMAGSMRLFLLRYDTGCGVGGGGGVLPDPV